MWGLRQEREWQRGTVTQVPILSNKTMIGQVVTYGGEWSTREVAGEEMQEKLLGVSKQKILRNIYGPVCDSDSRRSLHLWDLAVLHTCD